MPPKRVYLLTIIALSIFTASACAAPPWCPDLTNNNFVNFPDFSIMGANWRQSGPSLPGDFIYNGIVDINDLSYFSHWWLHDCYDPPIDTCPDCIYPDCNVIDCNSPYLTEPCPSCDTTPSFIKVKLEGIQNCPCHGDWKPQNCSCVSGANSGSSYYTGSVDGNYILPYIGYCTWQGFFNVNDMNVIYHREFGSCCQDLPWYDYKYKWMSVTVQRVFNLGPPEKWEIEIDATLYAGEQYPVTPDDTPFWGKADDIQNCVECIYQDPLSCSDPMAPNCCCYGDEYEQWMQPFGDGTTTISLPFWIENMSALKEDTSRIKETSANEGNRFNEERQKDLFTIQEAVLNWLEKE